MEIFTGQSDVEMFILQDGLRIGIVRCITIRSSVPMIMFTSLDRNTFRNDGSAVIEITFKNDDGTLSKRKVIGFRLSYYGDYDVNCGLEYTCEGVIDGS